MRNILLMFILCWLVSFENIAYAQQTAGDSLTINAAIKLALSNQPLINQAVEQINSINARIKEQNSSYYPEIEGDLSYAYIGPIISLSFPGLGNFAFNTSSNFDFHVSAGQTLYDFGKRDAMLDLIRSNKLSAEEKINLIKSNLAYQTIHVFYSILFIEKSIDVEDEQINTLNKHLDIARKKVESGSSTDFDVLTTQVRVASAQNELIDLKNTLDKAKILLINYTGYSSTKPLNLSGDFSINIPEIKEDSLLSIAYLSREEMKLARDNENSAKISTQIAGLNNLPTLSAGLSYGLKNGFFPDLLVLRGNWVAAVSANIPIFNGYRTEAQQEEAEANLKSTSQETLELERNIKAEVQSAISDLRTGIGKLKTTEIQVKQAADAVSRAEVEYQDGVITNLDLIDTETTLAEAKLLYLQVIYKNVINKYALDKVVGSIVW